MREKGIKPVLAGMPPRVRNWTLVHGGKYDMVTGDIEFDENEKKNLYPRKQFLMLYKRLERESSFPTESATSCRRPSGIRKKQDEHEAMEVTRRGALGFL